MRFLAFIICTIVFLAISCQDSIKPIDGFKFTPCEILEENILILNNTPVTEVINLWLSGLQPLPTSGDPIGHSMNLISLVDRLKSECHFDAVVECYACIETLPVLSEVSILMDSSGIEIKRVLDIRTPESTVMTLTNIHL